MTQESSNSSASVAGGRAESGGLVRGIGLTTAINLNVLNMIGVGPFITLPLMVVALGNRALLDGSSELHWRYAMEWYGPSWGPVFLNRAVVICT